MRALLTHKFYFFFLQLNQLKNDSACDLYFAVASRGNCNFSEKAYNVQNALPLPFHALIVANDAGKPPIAMSGAAMAENVTIPSVMISFGCSRSILSQYSASNGYVLIFIEQFYMLVENWRFSGIQ